MESTPSEVDAQLARRLRHLRSERDLTLEVLAQRSGVSRSMISLIERSESSPTANVLDKLAAGLGVTLASLFAAEASGSAAPLARRADQRVWRDPETGYLRRNLSPSGFPSAIELVEVVLPPGARVSYDVISRSRQISQQIWVLDGALQLSVDENTHHLAEGDCLAMLVGGFVVFRNPTGEPTRYLVALTTKTHEDARRR